jgi:hypothetical protein
MVKKRRLPPKTKRGIDYYFQLVANISQVVLVALAIFGYFYTVVPAYQNQLLNEENAKLTKDNQSIVKENEIIKGRYDLEILELKKKLDILENDYQTKSRFYDSLNAEYERNIAEKEKSIKDAKNALAIIDLRSRLMNFRFELANISGSRSSEMMYSLFGALHGGSGALDNLRDNDIDSFVDNVFKNPATYVENGLRKIIDKYANTYYDNHEFYVVTARKCLDYLATIRNDFSIKQDSIVNIKVYLRWYVSEKAKLQKERDNEKNIDKNLKISYQIIDLDGNARMDFLNMASAIIDANAVIEKIVNKIENEYVSIIK